MVRGFFYTCNDIKEHWETAQIHSFPSSVNPFKIVKLWKCEKYIVGWRWYKVWNWNISSKFLFSRVFIPRAKIIVSEAEICDWAWQKTKFWRAMEAISQGLIIWNESYSQQSATKDFLSKGVISWKWCFRKLNSDGCIKKIVPKEETPKNNLISSLQIL